MSTPTTILLQPEDSARIADAVIRQLRHPQPYSDQGFAEFLACKIAAAIERAVKDDLQTRKRHP